MSQFLLILLILLNYSVTSSANEGCNRIAIVNYKEVSVDSGSNDKGEGLRFYLERDKDALELLNHYQENAKPSEISTTASTIGSSMILLGILRPNDGGEGLSNRNSLVFGGLFLASMSFIITKTLQYNNETILQSAIEQYNKRNTPRIYFSPFKNDNTGFGIGIGVTEEF